MCVSDENIKSLNGMLLNRIICIPDNTACVRKITSEKASK